MIPDDESMILTEPRPKKPRVIDRKLEAELDALGFRPFGGEW
jgi:hypothetical protein